MRSTSNRHRSAAASAVYELLNPVPFGCFVAALIFDVVYARTGELLWDKSAAWLIALGLVFAVIPRLINLVWVWISLRSASVATDKLDFWLNLLAIVLAIVNAFVHSRDAYGVVPAGVVLSACSVILLSLAHVLVAVQRTSTGSHVHA